jgi:glucose/mannose-6-phosphate isomerase
MSHKLLDDAVLRAQADPGDMLGKTASFVTQLQDALDLPGDLPGETPGRLILGGMGGSAAVGRILAPILEETAGFRLLVVDGYRLPVLLPGDLLLLSSYSGETEEALSLFEEGGSLGVRRMVLSSGGELMRRAKKAKLACLTLPPSYPPRAALPSALGRLISLLGSWGLTPFVNLDETALITDLEKAAALCDPELDGPENFAKKAAMLLENHRPALVAMAPAYRGASQRLRAQFEENASCSSGAFELPELHHNSWVAWMEDTDTPIAPLWLGSPDAHPRTLIRRRFSEEALSDKHIPFLEIPALGTSLLNRVLTSILIGDFISVYHAILRKVDPANVDPLGAMKARLNQIT